MTNLLELIEEEITNAHSLDQVRQTFIDKGYLEEDVDTAITNVQKVIHGKALRKTSQASKLFGLKETFDRIGYGFASHQFINILFFITGGGLPYIFFIIGLVNGAKAILSVTISSFLQEFSKVHDMSKRVLSNAGILFGLSFLFIALAINLESVLLFSFALLVGSVGVVSYGDLYNNLIKKLLKRERRSHFLAKISYYGILITGVSLLISGWMLDKFPVTGSVVTFLGTEFTVLGYLLSFEITALFFILSGYVIKFIRYPREKTYSIRKFMGSYVKNSHVNLQAFVRNKYLFLLLVTSTLLGLVQVLGNSYYGIFIYQNFQDQGVGAFLNVAVVFFIAIIVSFFGPFITKYTQRHIGLSPMLVFGTILISFMPLVLAINKNLYAISAANSLAVIGSAIVGTANGLFARKLLPEKERSIYFSSLSIMIVIPWIILIPIGAFLAQFNMELFFLLLAGIILFIVAPLHFLMVLMSNREHKRL